MPCSKQLATLNCAGARPALAAQANRATASRVALACAAAAVLLSLLMLLLLLLSFAAAAANFLAFSLARFFCALLKPSKDTPGNRGDGCDDPPLLFVLAPAPVVEEKEEGATVAPPLPPPRSGRQRRFPSTNKHSGKPAAAALFHNSEARAKS